MKKLKALALILSVLMLASSFVSCGDNKEPSETDASNDNSETTTA